MQKHYRINGTSALEWLHFERRDSDMMFNQILITVVLVAVFIMYAALSLSAYRMIKQVCQKFLDMVEKLVQESE